MHEANDVINCCIDLKIDGDSARGLQHNDSINELSDVSNATNDNTQAIESASAVQQVFEMSFSSDDESNTTTWNVADNSAATLAVDHALNKPTVGDKVDVYWPLDNLYYLGIVAEEQNGSQTAVYDDGGIETLNFQNETWHYSFSAKLLSIHAGSFRLESNASTLIDEMLNYFSNRPFIRHQAQAFPTYVLQNAYITKEDDVKKNVKPTTLADVPKMRIS